MHIACRLGFFISKTLFYALTLIVSSVNTQLKKVNINSMSTLSGIDATALNPAIDPADDLYRHVNGTWISKANIPSDKARWGSFMMLAEQSEKAVHEIILSCANAPDQSAEASLHNLYTSFLDEKTLEAKGIGAITDWLDTVESISTMQDFISTIGELQPYGLPGFFQLFVDNDPGNPERYLVFIEQSGISLPEESYFKKEQFEPIRTEYLNHIQRMFALANISDPEKHATNVFNLEQAIANAHWDNVESRDSEKTYNLYTREEFEVLFPGTLLKTWIQALEAPQNALDTLVVRQPSFCTALGNLFANEPLEHWKSWLTWQMLHVCAPYLSKAFVDENFAFYGTALTGTPTLRPRWKRAVSFTENALGTAIGKIYVERHFPERSKTTMDELVTHLIEAYRISITDLEWMSEPTRQQALKKLEKFTPKIGYPKTWKDYSALTITPHDLMANARAISKFEFLRELNKINRPIDRDEWFMTPQTVNAYYNPGFNEIVFPAAILQYPFFSPERDQAANYGAIGAVIGHEISHGFDDQGSKFDGDGLLNNWWTEEDRTRFSEKAAALIKQYNALSPQQTPGHNVNGELTIGENIGDLGGLGIAWKAYQLSLNGKEPEIIDGLTGAERFFFSWAQAWQQKARDEEIIRLLTIDPHSPNEFRCNQIVRNIDAFYDTFNVTQTNALWLDPEVRVNIW